MRFLLFLAHFLSALAFLCCYYIFDSYVTCLTLGFNTVCFISFILTFGAYIALNIPCFSCIQIDFKDTHREQFRKVLIWTFGWLVHQIDSIYEVPKLKQNFWKKKVVTGKTPFFVIGQFCTLHFICLNMDSDRALL